MSICVVKVVGQDGLSLWITIRSVMNFGKREKDDCGVCGDQRVCLVISLPSNARWGRLIDVGEDNIGGLGGKI